MGRGMSANLLSKTFAGLEGVYEPGKAKPAFVIYDAFPSAVDGFLNTHVRAYAGRDVIPASSPAGVARLAATVFTMLPSSPQVEEVYLGENGLAEALGELDEASRKDSLFVDCTTLDQGVAKEVAARMRAFGADMVDAPVSGGESCLHDGLETSLTMPLMEVLLELRLGLCRSWSEDQKPRESILEIPTSDD